MVIHGTEDTHAIAKDQQIDKKIGLNQGKAMNKKKIILCFLGLCFLGFTICVIRWASLYFYDGVTGLKPELLFELPVDECGAISFSTNAYDGISTSVSSGVDEFCLSRGFQSELHFNHNSFFAVKGNKAARFVPEHFHSVKGGIEFESADPDTVYFYRYRAKYYQIVVYGESERRVRVRAESQGQSPK